MASGRGLGGSLLGEDFVRSRALNKGLRELEVPKEIFDTVNQLTTFIKDQHVLQSKIATICSTSKSGGALGGLSMSLEVDRKLKGIVDHLPITKDIWLARDRELKDMDALLQELQKNINTVWQRSQLIGLLPAGSGSTGPTSAVGSGGNNSKLIPLLESVLQELESKAIAQQQHLDELACILSRIDDLENFGTTSVLSTRPQTWASLQDLVRALSQAIINLAAQTGECSEGVQSLEQKVSLVSTTKFSAASSGSFMDIGGGINPFHLAGSSPGLASPWAASSVSGLSRGAPLSQGSGFQQQLLQQRSGLSGAPVFSAGSNNDVLPNASGNSGVWAGLRTNPPGNAASSATATVGAATTNRPLTFGWSSDTTNNRFSSAPLALGVIGSGGGELIGGTGKRSRAL